MKSEIFYPRLPMESNLEKSASIDERFCAAWLREQGFDPTGNLNEALFTNLNPWRTSTAMFEAASAGEIGVCLFLHSHGAAASVRTKNSNGRTPLYAACFRGHLGVVKWLCTVGALDDIHTKDLFGRTTMLAACSRGHLHVAKWLFNNGAARDIRTADIVYGAPLRAACEQKHLNIVLWLVLHGAANDVNSGHVNQEVLQSTQRGIEALDFRDRVRLRASLTSLIADNAHFSSLVLTAMHFDGSATSARPISRLCGHEETLLVVIADFAGILRGRLLRNAREVLGGLDEVLKLWWGETHRSRRFDGSPFLSYHESLGPTIHSHI